jgi:hypothetical protein
MNFIYTVSNHSVKRGYNKTIVVYRMVDNEPFLVGMDDKISTASYKGDKAVANAIIAEKYPEEYTMTDGYYIDQPVKLFQI